MCFSSGVAKVIDPGGYTVEKTTPKAFAPFSGVHGTSQAIRDLQAPTPPSPLRATAKPASQKLLGD